MINSIQHFQEKGIKKLDELIETLIKSPKDHAGFVQGVTRIMIQLGLDIISETFEDIDDGGCH